MSLCTFGIFIIAKKNPFLSFQKVENIAMSRKECDLYEFACFYWVRSKIKKIYISLLSLLLRNSFYFRNIYQASRYYVPKNHSRVTNESVVIEGKIWGKRERSLAAVSRGSGREGLRSPQRGSQRAEPLSLKSRGSPEAAPLTSRLIFQSRFFNRVFMRVAWNLHTPKSTINDILLLNETLILRNFTAHAQHYFCYYGDFSGKIDINR